MKRKIILAALALVAAISVSYSNYFLTGLHFGDYTIVRDNPAIRSLTHIPHFFFDLKTSATEPADYAYRPVVTTSLAIDYFLGGGLTPLAFHLSTFLVYLVGLGLIAWMYFSIFQSAIPHPWNPYLAIMTTALFGLHPAIAELLNPVSQRGELYAALGVVGGVALYAGLPRQRRYFFYLIPPLAGVFANPAGLIFGPMILAYNILVDSSDTDGTQEPLTPDQTRSRDLSQPAIETSPSRPGPKRVRIRRRKHPFRRFVKAQFERFMPTLLFTAAAGILHSFVTPFQSSGELVIIYWFTQPWVAFRYFCSFFAPTHLSPASDLTSFGGYHIDAVIGLAFVMILVSIALIVAVSSHWRPAVFGMWWFLLGILPGAALLQPDVEKDTRMFLPFIGLALTLTWTARMLLPSGEPLRRLQAIAAAILLLYMASATYARNRVWTSEEALWRDNVEKNPSNVRGLRNYAMVLASTGRNADAYEYLRKAHKLDPRSGEVMASMGTVAAALNQLDLADDNFGHARSLAAGRLVGYYPFATWMESQLKKHAWTDADGELRMRDRSVEAYSWAASLAPTDLRPLYGLMRIFSANSDWNNLRRTVEQARTILPRDAETTTFALLVNNHPDTLKGAEQLAREHPTPENLMTLSDAHWLAGDFNKCMETAQKALELRPGYARAYNNIGVAYLSLGHLDEAIESVRKALQSDPDNRMARANLIEWERQKLMAGNSIIRK